MTELICSECGIGRYLPAVRGAYLTLPYAWKCEHCGKYFTSADVELDDGECLTVSDAGSLAYTEAM